MVDHTYVIGFVTLFCLIYFFLSLFLRLYEYERNAQIHKSELVVFACIYAYNITLSYFDFFAYLILYIFFFVVAVGFCVSLHYSHFHRLLFVSRLFEFVFFLSRFDRLMIQVELFTGCFCAFVLR